MTSAFPFIQTGKRGRTRDQLLVAAQRLLLEHSAASLGIRQIAAEAGMVHGSFYNYYASIEALIGDLGDLFVMGHALVVGQLRATATDMADVFALTTRQTLRFVCDSPGYGRLLFDAGLPVDRFIGGLRTSLAADIARGMESGVFHLDNPDTGVSIVAGSILGITLDLHRRRLDRSVIDSATADLLVILGVPRAIAVQASTTQVDFLPPPPLPLRWQALGVDVEQPTA